MATKNQHALGSLAVCGTLASLLLAGCANRQSATTVVIEDASAIHISVPVESDEPWSSTYGPARPKLQHVVSLGTIDMPAKAPPAPPSTASPPRVVVHIDQHNTQTNVVVVAPKNRFARKHAAQETLPPPQSRGARIKPQKTKSRRPRSTGSKDEQRTRREVSQPMGHVPLPVSVPSPQ